MTDMTTSVATHTALHSSLSSEWYTPPEIIALVRTALGGVIDLDPASSEIGNRIVGAKRYYTQADDGLKQRWVGNVWLNCPYSSDGGADAWVACLLGQQFTNLVAIFNATTDRGWFTPLWRHATLCFLRRRTRFLETREQREERWAKRNPNKPCPPYKGEVIEGLIRGPQPTHGNVLAHFGRDTRAFIEATEAHGQIVVAPAVWRAHYTLDEERGVAPGVRLAGLRDQ
jgi:hypothetical protein